MLKEKFLAAMPKKRLHLHNGLVPWYRGGSSVFWSFHNHRPQDVGFTIQDVDIGIDTGGVFVRRSLADKVAGDDSEFDIVSKIQKMGVEELLGMIERVLKGGTPVAVANTKKGKNYTGRMLTPKALLDVYGNWRRTRDSLVSEKKIRTSPEDIDCDWNIS